RRSRLGSHRRRHRRRHRPLLADVRHLRRRPPLRNGQRTLSAGHRGTDRRADNSGRTPHPEWTGVPAMTQHITVIGGGLAGLTAAIACAETGAPVRLFEAHATLGGRGRATSGPYIAHDGAHVFYADGPHYTWLKARGFTAGLGWPAPRQLGRLGFRTDGRVRRIPPARMLRAQARFDLKPPVDIDFRSWASARWGEATAEHIANAIS